MIRTVLAADIGGTNSRFGLFRATSPAKLQCEGVFWLSTEEQQSFESLMGRVLDEPIIRAARGIDSCVIAVAGPVVDGSRSAPTNIAWAIDLTHLPPVLAGRSLLINDFEAQAYAAASSLGQQAPMVVQGQRDPRGTRAVIGPGTGLGKGIIAQAPDGIVVVPSEGGHVSLPIESPEDLDVLRFFGRLRPDSYACAEDMLSGSGLSLLHQCLTGETLSAAEIAAGFDEHYGVTARTFSKFLGRVCRNFALETLATGGVYIAGGIVARNPSLLTAFEFLREFRTSPKQAELMARIPVFLISDHNSGLWGAAYCGALGMEF